MLRILLRRQAGNSASKVIQRATYTSIYISLCVYLCVCVRVCVCVTVRLCPCYQQERGAQDHDQQPRSGALFLIEHNRFFV